MEEEKLSAFQRFEQWYFSKTKVWMWTGLGIVLLGLALMTARSLNDLTLTPLLVSGVTSGDIYERAITVETLLNHSTEQILLLAMSLLKLAIGGTIFMIVKTISSTGKQAQTASGGSAPRKPWFVKIFPILLVLGTDVQFVNVGVLMTVWDLNALSLLSMQFSGATTSLAYQQALTIDQLIGSLVVPVEFFGATLMLTGIPLGLASIVYYLRMQLTTFPNILANTFSKHSLQLPKVNAFLETSRSEFSKIGVSRRLLSATMLGFVLGISGLVAFAPIRTVNLFALLGEELGGRANSLSAQSARLVDSLMGITIEQLLFVGLGLLIYSINFWLLSIIKHLRAHRQFMTEAIADAGGKITPVERTLWTTRIVRPLATIGLFLMFVNFALALLADGARLTVFNELLAGQQGSAVFRDAVLADGVYTTLVKTVKLASFGFLLTAVAFNLVTIIINLRLTGLTLPSMFSNLLLFTSSNGSRSGERSETVLPKPMSLAPWRLWSIIFIGSLIAISTTLPMALVMASNLATFQSLAFAGESTSPMFLDSLLTFRILDDIQLPWKLLGMGLMLFGIGMTFGVIVGFVKARRVVIGEGFDSLASILQSQTQLHLQENPSIQNSVMVSKDVKLID
ncbi:MAG: hypothetical protein HY619_05230 [Thaumarchaeota archaeon]|nr:hypothetical protein [Nitrososphaerota archaeon]